MESMDIVLDKTDLELVLSTTMDFCPFIDRIQVLVIGETGLKEPAVKIRVHFDGMFRTEVQRHFDCVLGVEG